MERKNIGPEVVALACRTLRYTLKTYINGILDASLDLGEHADHDAAIAYAQSIGPVQVGLDEPVVLDDDGCATNGPFAYPRTIVCVDKA